MKAKLSTFSAIVALFGLVAYSPIQAQAQSVLPIQIDRVELVGDELVAFGLLGTHPFTAPVTIASGNGNNTSEFPCPPEPLCPVLFLSLGPIHLDLLGLVVDTSQICLLVAGNPGEGQLLGNLVCAVAGLLDGGISLEDLLAAQPNLLRAIRAILNDTLNQITSSDNIVTEGQGRGRGQGVGGGRDTAPGQIKKGGGGAPGNGDNGDGAVCPILRLVLGPVCLNVLGLVVYLDDCDGGPVTVDVTAQPGSGNLLGNLLCALVGLLDPRDIPAILTAHQ
jgi:hypothetical protein